MHRTACGATLEGERDDGGTRVVESCVVLARFGTKQNETVRKAG